VAAATARNSSNYKLLLMLQTAHLSRVYETSDVLVGLAGIITSGMDVMAQWPVRQVDAKPSAPTSPTRPDAKEKAKKPAS